MNIKLEFNDEGVIYELMDIVVLAHLKNTKTMLDQDILHGVGTEGYAYISAALDVLIGYFGK